MNEILAENSSSRQSCNKVSRNPNIILFSASRVQKITRSLVAWLIVVILLVPIVILNALMSVVCRMAVIIVAAAVLVTALSTLTNARTIEVFVSGATLVNQSL